MAALNIDLADDVRSRLQVRAMESGFERVEDYIQAMLLADVSSPEISDAKLESLLLERVNGPFVDVDSADFRQLHEKFEKRMSKFGKNDAESGS